MNDQNMYGKFDWHYFLRHIAIIAVPVALQNLLTTTGSMVDTMMLASLGEQTVGAVGLCAQFSSLMFAGYWGFVGGGMLFFAQYWGAKNDDGINRSFGLTLSFMMAVAVIFSFLALGVPEFIMNIYTDKPEIQQIGISYLRIVGFAYILQILAMAVSALLRSIEQVKIPLYGGIASVFANCFFNYLLIFGKFGLPKMGVRGAALGTVLAGVVNLGILLFFILKNKIPYVLEFSRHFRWDRAFVGQYLQKCFPILCNEILIGVGNMMINIVLGHQSEKAIAAVAVFRTLEGLVIAFFSGFSNAATVLVGKEVGAGNHEVAFQRAKRLVYLCSALIGTACLGIIVVHNPLLHAMGLSGESYGIGTGMLLIYSVAALIRMGNWTQNDTYRSAGDASFGSIMEITFMYLMVLPCVYLANYVFHAPFLLVFALCYVDEPVRYIIMQCHMYSGKWVKPVSEEGIRTIGEFRQRHGIRQWTVTVNSCLHKSERIGNPYSIKNRKGERTMKEDRSIGPELAMSALDEIPEAKSDARDIVGLVKSSGRITGYQLSDGNTVSKEDGVAMAKNGEIKGVGIAHRNDSEYLKSLPDGEEGNNLSNLPSVSQGRVDKDLM